MSVDATMLPGQSGNANPLVRSLPKRGTRPVGEALRRHRLRTLEVIRASHIKPWRLSTSEERLDPGNGLPLVATLDALFDAGLIAFASDGAMLVSERLPAEERDKLQLHGCRLRRQPDAPTAAYHCVRSGFPS